MPETAARWAWNHVGTHASEIQSAGPSIQARRRLPPSKWTSLAKKVVARATSNDDDASTMNDHANTSACCDRSCPVRRTLRHGHGLGQSVDWFDRDAVERVLMFRQTLATCDILQ